MYVIYTDGSAQKNGQKNSKGGFGVIVLQEFTPQNCHIVDAHNERENGTTNNRQEMKAIIWALEHYGGEDCRSDEFFLPVVYSDSMYCVNTFNTWMKGWKNNGWKRAGNKPVENLDLVQRYDELLEEGKKIDLRHCRGHAGNIWNELADQLATGKITVSEVLDNGSKSE